MIATMARLALLGALLIGPTAALAEDPPEVPDADERDVGEVDLTEAPSPSAHPVPVLDAEVATGLLLYADGLGIAPRVQLGLGVTPTALGSRLRLAAEVGWASPNPSGSVEDPRFSEPVPWSLTMHRLDLGLGAYGSLLGPQADLDVELFAVPRIAMLYTRARTGEDGAVIGHAQETVARGVLCVGAGVSGPVGPGELAAHVGVSLSDQDGVLAGDTGTVAPFLMLRYRHTLLERR